MSPATSLTAPCRGELVDIGGRRLRLVRREAGGRGQDGPTVVCEAGAFGFSADWSVVQEKLAARGLRSLSYDRAGLGYSDPAPGARNARAIVEDLGALLTHAGESGPLVLVGHSMAGLFVRLFALTHPQRVVGVVLVDAVTPEATDVPALRRAVRIFGALSRTWSLGAGLGLLKPFAPGFGDRIGLEGEAAREKRACFVRPGHNRAAAAEVAAWLESADQVRSAGDYHASWPLAVVTAGPSRGREGLRRIQQAPARRSAAPYEAHVETATHASLLGVSHAVPVVEAISHVLQNAGRPVRSR